MFQAVITGRVLRLVPELLEHLLDLLELPLKRLDLLSHELAVRLIIGGGRGKIIVLALNLTEVVICPQDARLEARLRNPVGPEVNHRNLDATCWRRE